jgi:hypothetical protein
MMFSRALFVVLLAGCTGASLDSGSDPAEDTSVDTDTDTVLLEPCDPAATFAGSIEGTSWEGSGIALSFFEPGRGAWSDGCYGGVIEDDLTLDGTTFDWSARFFAGAGAPEQRDIRAVGCVTDTEMELSIVEMDGTVFWGPWRLERSAVEVDVVSCD